MANGYTPPRDSLAALLGGAAQQVIRRATPLFTQEGNYGAAFAHNAAFAQPGPYQTSLTPQQQSAFRLWVLQNHVPVTKDYDMQGFFLASHGAQHPQGTHFPDTYKTPYDTSFSGESKYAKPGTPFVWQGNKLVDTRSGQVVFGPRP